MIDGVFWLLRVEKQKSFSRDVRYQPPLLFVSNAHHTSFFLFLVETHQALHCCVVLQMLGIVPVGLQEEYWVAVLVDAVVF